VESGYVNIWRKINDNPILSRNNNALSMFIKILTNADYKTGKFTTGRFKLADLCNMTPSNTYKTLKRLEMAKMVTLESNNKFTVITICKWKDYQQGSNNKSNNGVTTKEQQGNTIQTLIIKKKKHIGTDFEHLEPALTEFANMRKLIKAPLTDGALKRLIPKLNQLYPDDTEKQQAVLLQSVDHNWKGVFELKQDDPVRQKDKAWF
jgi:hypothetical protein